MMQGEGIRALLDENPIAGEQRAGTKRFWTGRELLLLREHYPKGGVAACLPHLVGRSAGSIYQRAGAIGLKAPATLRRKEAFRQRWTGSDAIDDVIRRQYPTCTTPRSVQALARTVGRPRWWVSKRARSLGLVTPRFKEPPWSEAELEIIGNHAHRDPKSIQRRLKSAGYSRTETAIVVKLKREGATREDPDHFTATGLSKLMGIDAKSVTRWIDKGWLKADRRGTDRVEAQGGDQWWIHRRNVRAFILGNASAVDIRKCDKFWLLELLGGPAG